MTDHRRLERDPILTDLLASRATQGLTPHQEQQLEERLRFHPEVDSDELLEAASLIDLAFANRQPHPPLPKDLRQRLTTEHRARVGDPGSGAQGPRLISPWWIPATAAAAAVALLGFAAFETFRLDASPQQARAQLIASGEVFQWEWNPPSSERFAGVRGDVVWSPSDQAGFLTFTGLPALDPSQEQYQLWIVDASSQRKHPVDGGLFDHLGGEAPVVVPFSAKLEVFEAAAFAITVEECGGVVVSDGPLEIVASGS